MDPLLADVAIRTTTRKGPIPRRIFGHFLEQAFFGNIDGGVFDEGSALSVHGQGPLDGCRADVVAACRDLEMPVVRWPGGNFTSAYWWQDGTGPRDARPRRLELAWGSEETNRFGTPEFLAWCRSVGAEPFLCHNLRSVDDAVRWVEYCNHAGDTTLTRLRRQDGLADPVRVSTWGLGNEVYGRWQMGHRPVAQYVLDARQHGQFMRAVDPGLEFVAVGLPRESWTIPVVEGLADLVRHLSLHLYGVSMHRVWDRAGEFDHVVSQPVYFESLMSSYRDLIGEVGARVRGGDRLEIAMDEWNLQHWMRHDGTPTGFEVDRSSPRTLADVLFYAGMVHAMLRTVGEPVPITMANTVNLVNANGLLHVGPEGLVKQATYHVWQLLGRGLGSHVLASTTTAPAETRRVRHGNRTGDRDELFATRQMSVPLVDVVATGDERSHRRSLSVINRDPARPAALRILEDGRPLAVPVAMRVLGGPGVDPWAANTPDSPLAVVPWHRPTIVPDAGVVHVPPRCLAVLEWRDRGDGPPPGTGATTG